MTLLWAGVGTAAAVLVGALALRGTRASRDEVACGTGFTPAFARCCAGASSREGACDREPVACPPPLTEREGSCDAPDARVAVSETTVIVGASDWEAEGRVAARTIRTARFAIDAFEATRGRFGCASCAPPSDATADRARAASGMTRAEAASYCRERGGRLPTEDEWIVAAAGSSPRRYPWGDTGAVCRRAAWGLATGPCSSRGRGADTVGAHPDGDTPEGLHDMAGNVAEWTAPSPEHPNTGIARGGSWASALAADLRTWARLEVDPEARDPRVGVRCAYDTSGLPSPVP